MQARSRVIDVYVYDFSELGFKERELLIAAAEVRAHAQAPYSNYFVGAAVLAEDGHITVGCNVERCTYTQSSHAEQVAVDGMVARGGSTKILAVAVIAGDKKELDEPIDKIPPGKMMADFSKIPVPCGHCLQIIWENCGGDDKVLLYSWVDGLVYVTTIGEALPMRFGPDNLGVKL